MNAPFKAGRLAGYAAVFDLPDGMGDRISPGAFARSLAERTTPFPLLWQHRGDQCIGWAEYVAEDARGLRVIARIDAPHSRAAAALSRHTASGLSFGYRARRFRRCAGGRWLDEIELFEISLVTDPMHPLARVHWSE
ncbi:HK97 family phage prohead protease [Altericroceibacterium endophyticum]|uniref:HK97 family phage prohead protease n=1 Tax=Altericroceibacterium endophyticum TaxID=1808508 RepID=A0A6I4T5S6_9SPHN|nr:HK97 family phage prohead protease [Altericroceibacterium endophyticum]MXO65491.1 HK97 family phage prohead protease [Altericroceibacterium endophyticum]